MREKLMGLITSDPIKTFVPVWPHVHEEISDRDTTNALSLSS